MTEQSPQISVVIPVYRNEETLEELCRLLCLELKKTGQSFELLFVVDASPDHSSVILEEIRSGGKPVKILNLDENIGQQRAILQGVSQSAGKYVVVMDADLQDPPYAIPSLLETLIAGKFDAVFAGRKGIYQSIFRMACSKIFKWLVHLLARVPVDAGAYVIMTRRMADQLLEFKTNQPYLVGMIGCTGLPVNSVPVRRSKRTKGSSAYNFWSRLSIGVKSIVHIISWRINRWGSHQKKSKSRILSNEDITKNVR